MNPTPPSMNMPTSTGTAGSKKTWLVVTAVVVVLLAAVLVFLAWFTSPKRTMDKFLSALEAKDQQAVMSMVSPDISEGKKENIQWFVEDWTLSETVTVQFEKEESWREIPEEGKEKVEFKPSPKYWASFYQAYVTVTFTDGEDEYEDPVIVKLQRTSANTSSSIAQLFRGWKVAQVKYQPLDEEDFEDIELDDSSFEIDEENGLSEEEEIEGEEGEVTEEDDAAGTVEEGTVDDGVTAPADEGLVEPAQ